eukprot:13490981-Alexandrium_andersonii.AAC.1
MLANTAPSNNASLSLRWPTVITRQHMALCAQAAVRIRLAACAPLHVQACRRHVRKVTMGPRRGKCTHELAGMRARKVHLPCSRRAPCGQRQWRGRSMAVWT